MKYNIVAIDPSLISTALVVSSPNNFKMFNYCKESKVYNKKGLAKWFKMAEEYIIYRFIEYREFDNYSEGELIKLKDYDKVSDMIINDILDNIDNTIPTKIGIEGYSYSSDAGAIIDLVTFSALLRKKLFDRVSEDIEVLSPSTLKLESCKLSYPPILKESGKKVKKITEEYRNPLGIPGGKFTKLDMYHAIIDDPNYNDPWSKHCRLIKGDMLSISKIEKPYEDVNDSYTIYKYLNKKRA